MRQLVTLVDRPLDILQDIPPAQLRCAEMSA